jgi:hypothetical protein
LSDQPFFIADHKIGRISVHDATGFGAALGGFTIPNAAETGFDAPITAISCAFNPATITLAGGAAGSTLTVSTLASVSHYGLLMPGLVGPCVLLVAVVWFSLVMRCSENFEPLALLW